MYASLDSLRQYLPQITETGENDDVLESCLSRATGIVRDAMRAMLADRAFDYVAWGVASTKVVRGYGGSYLTLPPHQAGSVALVEYQSGTNPAIYTAVADQYLQEDGQLYRSGGWSYPSRYRVTAIWGYGATVPESVVQVTLELAGNFWRGKDKAMWTDTIGVDGAGSVKYTGGMTNLQKQVLENVCAQLYQVAV